MARSSGSSTPRSTCRTSSRRSSRHTRRDRGELPFAVARTARFTRSRGGQRPRGGAWRRREAGRPADCSRERDWIVVTTEDKSGSGLRLGIARPVGDSLATLRERPLATPASACSSSRIALVGIVPLSSRLTRNLSTLSEAVGRIAQGDYRARVPVKSNDEVGKLARARSTRWRRTSSAISSTAVEQERIRRELELGPPDSERDAAARAAASRTDGGAGRVGAGARSRRRLLQLLRARQRPDRAADGRRVRQGRRRRAADGEHPGRHCRSGSVSVRISRPWPTRSIAISTPIRPGRSTPRCSSAFSSRPRAGCGT